MRIRGTAITLGTKTFGSAWTNLTTVEFFVLPGGALNNITVAYVPEPSSLALFGVGLSGLGFAVRRRRKH